MISCKTDLKAFVIEEAAFPSDLVEEITNVSSFNFSQITRGIVLVFARWSSFPILAIRHMRGPVLSSLRRARAPLFLIDNDLLSETEMHRLFGRQLRGGGETFLVIDGEIRGECVYSEKYPA